MIMHQELQVHKKISSLNSLHSSAKYLKVRGANLIKIKANSPAHTVFLRAPLCILGAKSRKASRALTIQRASS